MRQYVLRALLVSLVIAGLLGMSGALAAQEATPGAPGAESALPIETLVTTTFSEDTLPTASSPAFVIWYATIDPETEVAVPTELVACCPGPQIEHVLAGALTVRVEGPLQIVRGATRGTPAPLEQVPPGTETVLHPGDTGVYAFDLPVTYRNAGSEPVHVVAGGFFGGSPPAPPADYAIPSSNVRYPAPPLPPGPVQVTLQRTTLPPDGVFPAPPSGAVQLVMTGPELGTLGERSDGSAQNLGREPVDVYALILIPTGAGAGTPTTP